MAMTAESCDAVILAGGTSRRMGRCKALLPLDGQSMLLRTRAQLTDFKSVLISCNDPQLAAQFHAVQDFFPDAGPLAGIHAALRAAKKEALFVIPCDLPHFSQDLPRLLLSQMEETTDVLICRDSSGGLHPLCGIYRKRTLPVLEACLQAGKRKIMDFVQQTTWKCLDTEGLLPDRIFFNMNTPEDYQAALSDSEQKQP